MAWPKGRPRAASTIQAISAARKRACADPAVREKMSAARKRAFDRTVKRIISTVTGGE